MRATRWTVEAIHDPICRMKVVDRIPRSWPSSWKPIADAWRKLHHDYESAVPGDCVWWMSERANAALLAAAAISTNVASVVEFEDRAGLGKANYVDLWVDLGGRKKCGSIFEVKKIPMSLRNSERNQQQRLRAVKKWAANQLRDLISANKPGYAGHLMVFLVPYCPASWSAHEVEDGLTRLQQAIRETQWELVAWYEASVCPSEGKKAFPGVFLLISRLR